VCVCVCACVCVCVCVCACVCVCVCAHSILGCLMMVVGFLDYICGVCDLFVCRVRDTFMYVCIQFLWRSDDGSWLSEFHCGDRDRF